MMSGKNIANSIHVHANHDPDKTALVLLDKNPLSTIRLSYQELDRRAGAIAAKLHAEKMINEKIILLYQPGIDLAIALTACFYAGAIPILVAPPESKPQARTLRHLDFVMKNANAACVLANTFIINRIKENAIQLNTKIMNTDETITSHEFFLHDRVDRQSVALIQYSSGTSGESKGVIITHDNLMQSVSHNSLVWNLKPQDISLAWTPPYTIYGIMTGLLLPLFNANTNYLIAAEQVLDDPYFWLESISKQAVTYSGCPNFGYQLCVDSEKKDKSILDLSKWRIAINGGEFIRAATLQAFYEKFKHDGFKFESFCPSYGMTEMTGFISSKKIGEDPRFIPLEKNALQSNKLVKMDHSASHFLAVSCGHLSEGLKLSIINPTTLQPVSKDEIGEICLMGDTLSQGYFNRSYRENEILIDKEKVYFRTGDMGFYQNDELYIVNRLKEIMIINGKNYFPDDIETSIKQSMDLFNHRPVMAVSLDIGDEEKVLVMVEMDEEIPSTRYQELVNIIQSTVLNCSGLVVNTIVLVKHGSILKTRGGKVQRIPTKNAYLSRELDILYEHHVKPRNNNQSNALFELLDFSSDQEQRLHLIKDYLSSQMQAVLNIDLATIHDGKFFDLGMTSLSAVQFRDRVQKGLEDKIQLPPSFVFEYPSLMDMSAYIENRLAKIMDNTYATSNE